jgi:hypothetical protein
MAGVDRPHSNSVRRRKGSKPPAQIQESRPPAPAAAESASTALQQGLTDVPAAQRASNALVLQRAAGNRAVARLAKSQASTKDRPTSGTMQAKLTVGPAGDSYEQEAERVADRVMRMQESAQPLAAPPNPADDLALHRKPLAEQIAPKVQRQNPAPPQLADPAAPGVQRSADGSFEAGSHLENRLAATHNSGQALDDSLRRKMETRFGSDFGSVRVHNDTESHEMNREIQAQAFTHGSNIYFGAGKYDPGTNAGQHLVAHELTHVVQQGGAGIQRHPSHAEEEEVQAKPLAADIQRHPSHAEEEDVQAKPLAAGSLRQPPAAGREQIQARPVAASLQMRAEAAALRRLAVHQHTGARIQRGLGGWLKNRWKGVAKREQEMTAKYGITIGPGNTGGHHFSHAVLDKLDKILSRLPLEHLRDTYLTNISKGDGIGSASAYSQDDDTHGHIGIVQPPVGPFKQMPGWLYTMLSKGVGWQRKMMDEGAISSLAEDVSPASDQALGLDNAQRQVMAGVSDVLARGNLVEWTVRHEMGHAVDHKIKWTARRARLAQFGGWKMYENDNQDGMEEVARVFMGKVGIDYPDLVVRDANKLIDYVVKLLKGESDLKIGPGSRAEATKHDAQFAEKYKELEKLIGIARAQPWMFPDGGAGQLADHGRVYHLDHYGTWVSYLEAQRSGHALSNYQFSSPGEWFAEAYAAYYDPAPASRARARLNDATRNWFEKNLGRPPQPGQPKPAAGALSAPPVDGAAKGNLRELTALAPELLAELEGGEEAGVEDVPEDMKQDEDNRLGGF